LLSSPGLPPYFNTPRTLLASLPSERTKASFIVRNVGQLVTISGHSKGPCAHPDESSLGLIGDKESHKTCIASKDGKICFVGNSDKLSDTIDSSSAIEIDAHGRLVLPGFVDCHTHTIFSGSREDELNDKLSGVSYLDILKKGGGILRTMRQTRVASDNQILDETQDRLKRMVSFGTTTVEIKTGYGLDLSNEMRLLRIMKRLSELREVDIVPTLLSAHAIPPEFSGNSAGYIGSVVKPTIDGASKEGLAEFCDVFMEEGVFGAQETTAILEYAYSMGLKKKIHADEFSDLGGAALGARMNVVSADHLMRASSEGIKALAQGGVVSVLLPGTSLSSFSPSYANAREAIRQGGAVALATDSSPNSWIESMQLIISLACYCMKMTPAEALVGATINAAHAVSRASSIGSIELGKKCDLLIMNLSNYQEIPYRIGSNNVSAVIKNGNLVIGQS
jgi:imidazolonepropionase